MFAEKVVQKFKPTEACGRRIAQGGLFEMFAQTKRLNELGFQGEGRDRNLPSPWSPLWFLSGDAERNVKKIKLTQNIRLTQIKISILTHL